MARGMRTASSPRQAASGRGACGGGPEAREARFATRWSKRARGARGECSGDWARGVSVDLWLVSICGWRQVWVGPPPRQAATMSNNDWVAAPVGPAIRCTVSAGAAGVDEPGACSAKGSLLDPLWECRMGRCCRVPRVSVVERELVLLRRDISSGRLQGREEREVLKKGMIHECFSGCCSAEEPQALGKAGTSIQAYNREILRKIVEVEMSLTMAVVRGTVGSKTTVVNPSLYSYNALLPTV